MYRYLPRLVIPQLSRIHAGSANTDIRDASVIAFAGNNLTELLHSVDRKEAFIQLKSNQDINEDQAEHWNRFTLVPECNDTSLKLLNIEVVHC